MNLYFQNSQGIRRKIGTPINREEINKLIKDFLKEHNFKSYYTRTWKEKDELWFDVGSHTEFFIVTML